MAAITKTAIGGSFRRSASAQADTGQTDWFMVPSWARYAKIILDVTAVAGTTPIADPSILSADPKTADDANVAAVATFTTPPTAAGTHIIDVGPGVSGIADDLALAATGDSTAKVNIVLPTLMGLKMLLDRTTGNETYTYTISVIFRP